MGMSSTQHAVAMSVLGGMYFGFNLGVISGLTSSVVQCHYFPETPRETQPSSAQSAYSGIFTACILVGGIAGAVLAVPVADRFGRRAAYVGCGLVGLLAGLQFVLDAFWPTIVVRTLIGVPIGGVSVVCPLYVTEVVSPALRGSTGTVFQVAICFSILLGQVLNLVFSPDYNPNSPDTMCVTEWRWKTQLGLGMLPGLVIVLHGMLLLPESQDWLFRSGRIDAFGASQQDSAVAVYDDEYEYGQDESDPEQTPPGLLMDDDDAGALLPAPLLIRRPAAASIKSYTWGQLLGTREGLEWAGIGLGLAASAQLTGVNAIILYSPTIFKDAGMHDVLYLTVGVVGTWNFVSVFAAVALVDKLGRRPLMLCALVGMTASMALLGSCYAFLGSASQGLRAAVTVAGLMGFLFFFEIGPGSLFFLMASETFPRVVRSKALVFANVCNWLSNILISFGFPVVETAIGPAATFFVLALVGLVCTTFVFHKLPETKGELPPTPLAPGAAHLDGDTEHGATVAS